MRSGGGGGGRPHRTQGHEGMCGMAAPGAPTPGSHLGGGVSMQGVREGRQAATGAQTIAGGGGGGGRRRRRHGKGQQSAQAAAGGRRKQERLQPFPFPLLFSRERRASRRSSSSRTSRRSAGSRRSRRPPSWRRGEGWEGAVGKGSESPPEERGRQSSEGSSAVSGCARRRSGRGGAVQDVSAAAECAPHWLGRGWRAAGGGGEARSQLWPGGCRRLLRGLAAAPFRFLAASDWLTSS